MTIEVCIPTIKAGIHCMDFFIDNLLSTASKPDEIVISTSYHDEEDLAALRNSKHSSRISMMLKAPSYTEGMLTSSSNHSSAINTLAKNSHCDIVIFSDYDMAFLKHGWDNCIKEILKEKDFFGTPYAPIDLSFGVDPTKGIAPWLVMQKMIKYQKIPNLGFFAIGQNDLKKVLADGPLTNFDTFLVSGNLPFRFVFTHQMAEELNLPLGSLNWMDTGHEITGFPAKYGFTYKTLEYVFAKDSEVFNHKHLLSYIKHIFRPEIFHLDGEPFLFHFKKGSMKAQLGGDANFFEYFVEDVNSWLKAHP